MIKRMIEGWVKTLGKQGCVNLLMLKVFIRPSSGDDIRQVDTGLNSVDSLLKTSYHSFHLLFLYVYFLFYS